MNDQANIKLGAVAIMLVVASRLWTGEEPADITDLVGNCPRQRVELRAKGDTWSSGLIGLNKYASNNDKV